VKGFPVRGKGGKRERGDQHSNMNEDSNDEKATWRDATSRQAWPQLKTESGYIRSSRVRFRRGKRGKGLFVYGENQLLGFRHKGPGRATGADSRRKKNMTSGQVRGGGGRIETPKKLLTQQKKTGIEMAKLTIGALGTKKGGVVEERNGKTQESRNQTT